MHPLQAERQRQHKSRERLGAKAEVSPRTIYGIELQGIQPIRATRRAIADALGCEPATLFEDASETAAAPSANDAAKSRHSPPT